MKLTDETLKAMSEIEFMDCFDVARLVAQAPQGPPIDRHCNRQLLEIPFDEWEREIPLIYRE